MSWCVVRFDGFGRCTILYCEQRLTFFYIGPLRIYRAPGSVAFLHCQHALKPILPKSQCWAVDDDSSKFVLQIRRPQYWRIEIPNETSEDRRRAEELKGVLGKVLLFEKTPCPFKRSFVVELPETPKSPIKKKPWRPMERPSVVSLHKDSSTGELRNATPASSTRQATTSSPILEKSELSAEVSEIESNEESLDSEPLISPLDYADHEETNPSDSQSAGWVISVSDSPAPLSLLEPSLLEEESVFVDFTGLEEDDSYSDNTDDTNITPRSHFQPTYQSMTSEPDKETRIQQPLQLCSRSKTVPPFLSLVTSPPSKDRTASPLRNSSIVELDSDFSSSVDSFHSVQSWHSPLAPPSPPSSGPPSPVTQYPYPHDNIFLPKRSPHHTRDVSELTVKPETPREWETDLSSGPASTPASRSRSLSPPPKTPTLVNDNGEKSDDEQSEITTPPTIRSTVRHRATIISNSRRRALSPLPAAVNLFSPPRQRSRRLQTARHLPTAIIQKTCEILLSPPSHLAHLLLSIASKIAAGEWRGVLSGHGESVNWDFEDEYAGEGWMEDDYGISIPTKTKKSTNIPGGSWEID